MITGAAVQGFERFDISGKKLRKALVFVSLKSFAIQSTIRKTHEERYGLVTAPKPDVMFIEDFISISLRNIRARRQAKPDGAFHPFLPSLPVLLPPAGIACGEYDEYRFALCVGNVVQCGRLHEQLPIIGMGYNIESNFFKILVHQSGKSKECTRKRVRSLLWQERRCLWRRSRSGCRCL